VLIEIGLVSASMNSHGGCCLPVILISINYAYLNHLVLVAKILWDLLLLVSKYLQLLFIYRLIEHKHFALHVFLFFFFCSSRMYLQIHLDLWVGSYLTIACLIGFLSNSPEYRDGRKYE
jgi:hypothetical protein